MDVKKVAKLANLTLTPLQEKKLKTQLSDTLSTIAVINELDTSEVKATFQVTGLTNVTREDTIDNSRILSQSLAISQSPRVYKGFVVVPHVFHEE
jgi:aspartyl-tRNA(Asn)/glutamyl-tRNA(Gln) amidotransferase subunit C